jgi:ankyrin repeat protein
MNIRGAILRLTCAAFVLTGWCCPPRTQAQQSGPATSSDQEFLEAIKKGNSAKVGELLKQNPALIKATTRNGTTPVLLAVYAQHPEIAESLLATGIEPNIFEAVATGRIARVQELLNKNPELVKAYSPDGWTALHLSFGNLEVVKFLLDKGADINAVSKNQFSASPLQGAAAFHKIDLARFLIDRGANVNCCAAEGEGPLHEAAGSGQIELAKLLLDHGANINARDNKGNTPLTIALEYKQAEMAKFLRDHKATQ